jgi:long-chain acyl-CoA synthetase
MPDMNLSELLRARADRAPHSIALFCGDRTTSYAELDASTDSLAAWFRTEGLQSGDRVALQWPNTIEAVQLYFAAFKAGLIAVPINLRLKSAETAWIVQNSGASLCFTPPALADAMRQTGVPVRTELPACATAPPTLAPVDDESPALILYTSGSTGRPKGAVHSHRSLLVTGELCTQAFEDAFGDATIPRALLMTPLMHASGLYVLLSAIRLGEPCVLLPMFDPAAALDTLEQFRCTLTLALPVMMQVILAEQLRKPRDLSALRVIFAGGDSVPVALQERVRDVMGVGMAEGLAQTETGPTMVNPLTAQRLGSLGVVCRGVDVRIVDAAGRPVSDNDPGELLVRSPALCSAYWRNPEATAEALRDGWFHTGDLVSRDADGYYWFRGRLKEIIIRGGSNISPQEVEEALYTHPAILEAGVVGLPHDMWGETVVAVVALREGAICGEDDIRDHARQTLADYKVPERVYFLPVLPKGATGKVHRRALKDILADAAPRSVG